MSDQEDRFEAGDPPADQSFHVPAELPVLPLRDTVLFPNSFMPLAVARESSVRLIDEAVTAGRMIAVFTQREASEEDPRQDDLFAIGTASHIHKMFKLPDGSLRIIVQGLARVRLDGIIASRPYLLANVSEAPEELADRDRLEIDALQRNIKVNFQQIVSLSPLMSDDLQTLASNITEPGRAADFIASSLGTISTADEAGSARNARCARPPRQPEPAAHQGTRGARARVEDPVAGPVGGRQEPARLLPARAAQGDSARAGRRRRPVEGRRGTAPEDRCRRAARHRQEGSPARARSTLEDAGRRRRVHGVAHLPRLDRRAAVDRSAPKR